MVLFSALPTLYFVLSLFSSVPLPIYERGSRLGIGSLTTMMH
jgi:hypothetical protein